jgi:hypothetical protein
LKKENLAISKLKSMNETSYRSKTNPLVLNTAPPTKIRNIFSSHAEALITPEMEI